MASYIGCTTKSKKNMEHGTWNMEHGTWSVAHVRNSFKILVRYIMMDDGYPTSIHQCWMQVVFRSPRRYTDRKFCRQQLVTAVTIIHRKVLTAIMAHILSSVAGAIIDLQPVRRALLSVSDKTGLIEIATILASFNVWASLYWRYCEGDQRCRFRCDRRQWLHWKSWDTGGL